MASAKRRRVATGIYELERGVFELVVSRGRGSDGRYRQRTERFRGTLREAKRARATLLTTAGDTGPLATEPGSSMTFRRLLDLHLERMAAHGHSAPAGANLNAGLTFQPFGSVLALAQGGGANCSGVAASSVGFNFSDDSSCGFLAGTDKQNGGDPQLGSLANNGGGTPTRVPQPGSPLIDAIPNAHCQDGGPLTTDQRGFPRPSPPGGACDIGAVEVQPAPPVSPASTPLIVTPRFTG